jgi:hypothetical protein
MKKREYTKNSRLPPVSIPLAPQIPIIFIFGIFLLSICHFAFAQDGSSELGGEKSAAAINSRLRVRCTDDSLRLYQV